MLHNHLLYIVIRGLKLRLISIVSQPIEDVVVNGSGVVVAVVVVVVAVVVVVIIIVGPRNLTLQSKSGQ